MFSLIALAACIALPLAITAPLVWDCEKARRKPVMIRCPNGHLSISRHSRVMGVVPRDILYAPLTGKLREGPFDVPLEHCAQCQSSPKLRLAA